MGNTDARRVTRELAKLGWKKSGQFKSGPLKGSARYVAPEGGGDA
jgi:hypothetical protein